MRWKSVGVVMGPVCLVVGQSALAAADPAPTAQSATTAPIKNDTGKRICKVLTPTGSRFERRVCKTADQWQHDEQQAQNQIDENRRGNGDLTPPR